MKNILSVLIISLSFSLSSLANNFVPNTPIYQTNALGATNTTNNTPISNNAYNNQVTYLPGVGYQPFVNVDLGWNQHVLDSLQYSPIGMSLMPPSNPQMQSSNRSYYGRPAFRYGY